MQLNKITIIGDSWPLWTFVMISSLGSAGRKTQCSRNGSSLFWPHFMILSFSWNFALKAPWICSAGWWQQFLASFSGFGWFYCFLRLHHFPSTSAACPYSMLFYPELPWFHSLIACFGRFSDCLYYPDPIWVLWGHFSLTGSGSDSFGVAMSQTF